MLLYLFIHPCNMIKHLLFVTIASRYITVASQECLIALGLYSLRRRHLISIGIPIINLRRSSDRLRFIMGIPIPVRRRLLSEQRPRSLDGQVKFCITGPFFVDSTANPCILHNIWKISYQLSVWFILHFYFMWNFFQSHHVMICLPTVALDGISMRWCGFCDLNWHIPSPYITLTRWVYRCYATKKPLNPGAWINIKMTSYQYRKSHCGDKTILRQSYLHNGISYTGKTAYLYWFRALILFSALTTTVVIPQCQYIMYTLWYIYDNVYNIWARSRRCGCLVTWFCYHLIAKPGNKTAASSCPEPYICFHWVSKPLPLTTVMLVQLSNMYLLILNYNNMKSAGPVADIYNLVISYLIWRQSTHVTWYSS